MSTNQTPNYALSQWEAGDQVLRADFNADNAKIDAALAQLQTSALRIHTGNYVGSGKPVHLIELPFRPVFFWLQKGQLDDVRLMLFGGLNTVLSAPYDSPVKYYQRCNTNGQGAQITWEGNGLQIYTSGADSSSTMYAMNEKGFPYFYVAIG